MDLIQFDEKSHAVQERSIEDSPQHYQNKVGMPSYQEMMVYQTYAKMAVDSQMYRGVGKEAAVMMIILAAREYGIGPAQALNRGFHIVEGCVEMSARVMSGLIRRAKHSIKITENTDKSCTITGKRSDNGDELTVTYTFDMAIKAGLVKDKGAWKRTPEDMLYARCISRLARQLFSDVIGVGYIEGEISDSRACNEPLNQFVDTSPTQTIDYSDKSVLDMQKTLNDTFDESERESLKLFIKEIQTNRGWSEHKTLIELTKDLNITKQRFQTWQSKLSS